ncbi:uncharacterized protein LOC132563501 [Ylistrum balloti]|uniref:uncharacterized protein LOC132563501 n=1 Tax=Ylistrum balloti TaxID=509963 RepID=UPI0029057DBA|nr:uncharacterized protein LOC132563501 [Ylistrum balloti]
MSILLQRKQAQAGRRVVVRKAGEVEKGKDACLSCAWEVDLEGQKIRISFSRDNLHVWITGDPVDTTAYISDHKYDLDLDFEICPGYRGHIFSDVNDNRTEIKNHLFINEQKFAETVLTYSKNSEHFKNIRKGR